MKIEIKSKREYHEMMVEIYNLMNKGASKLTKSESTKLSKMAIAAELYEDEILGFKLFKEPETIPELVELKLFEHKMTQARLAEEIGLAKSKEANDLIESIVSFVEADRRDNTGIEDIDELTIENKIENKNFICSKNYENNKFKLHIRQISFIQI